MAVVKLLTNGLSDYEINRAVIKKGFWILFVSLAIIIGLYPAIYLMIDRKFGLLSTKNDELLTNIFWNIGFYTHIFFGGLSLLTGWIQFNAKFRNNHLKLHRKIGIFYILSVIFSSISAIYISFFATGGPISTSGFFCLGIIWFYTTLMAYVNIKNNKMEQHQRMMIYSYAACFAAVTLRLWLPILNMIFGDFIIAYTVVSWLCWVPNLIVANLIINRFVKH